MDIESDDEKTEVNPSKKIIPPKKTERSMLKSAVSETLDTFFEQKHSPGEGILEDVTDLPLTLHVEIARKALPLREVLEWKTEGVVVFPKLVGEAVEVFIGEQMIARGEIVIINDHYGVRLHEITRPEENYPRA